MRHRKKNKKLGRTAAHRRALLRALVCSLIEHQRVKTTVAKAKQARVLAERMVTLAKEGTLSARRAAMSALGRASGVGKLFATIAPALKDRAGGYTRIVRIGRRRSDGAEMAFLEWVNLPPVERKRKRKTTEKQAQE